jgi:hypothetical protein
MASTKQFIQSLATSDCTTQVIRYLTIDRENCEALTKALRANKKIDVVTFERCKVDAKGFICFLHKLYKTGIRALGLSSVSADCYNDFSTKVIYALAGVMKRAKLKTLQLVDFHFAYAEKSMRCLMDAIVDSEVKSLHLACTNLQDVGLDILSYALPKTKLEYLYVGYNFMHVYDAAVFFDAVSRSPSMKKLNIDSWFILNSPQCYAALTKMVATSNLTSFSMAHCLCGDQHVNAIAIGIKQSLTLEYLLLSHNCHITSDGMLAFIKNMGLPRSLRTVDVSATQVDQNTCDVLRRAVKGLQCDTTLALQAMMSVKQFPRLGQCSKLSLLSVDIIRALASYLPYDV